MTTDLRTTPPGGPWTAPARLPRHELRRGALAMLPLLAGYTPFGLLIGVAVAANPTPAAGAAGAWLIFGGSAHLLVLQMTAAGAPVVVTALTGLLVNARVSVLSAGLAADWRGAPLRHRALAAALVLEPTWALAERRAAAGATAAERQAHHVGAGVVLAAGWAALIGTGAVLGARLESQALQVLGPACLVALVGPHLRGRSGAAAATAAAAVALGTLSWPAGTGLLAAMAAGTVAAALAGRTSRVTS
jgi:predicted branched-subunit amino acid permease